MLLSRSHFPSSLVVEVESLAADIHLYVTAKASLFVGSKCAREYTIDPLGLGYHFSMRLGRL